MAITKFYDSLKKEYCLSEIAISILQAEFIEENIEKGSCILEQGKLFYEMIFLVKGVACSLIEKEEKEIIPYIGFDGDLIALPLNENFRSSATLIAIENCILLQINIKRFEEIIQNNAELSFMSYRLFKKMLAEVAREYFDYWGVEAKDQYLKLIEENPEILNRVPLKYIASNLGVTPSSLSRIRAQIVNRYRDNKK